MTHEDTTQVRIPFPDADSLQLYLAVGACRLRIHPGDGDLWVTGTYRDPSGVVPLTVSEDGGTVRMSQKADIEADLRGFLEGAPEFDLALGRARPFELGIQTGASENVMDLGGLPLLRLVMRHGAGRSELDFSEPNPESMTELRVQAGVGATGFTNLTNANAADLRFDAGAAAYDFGFGGVLRRDMCTRITAAAAAVTLSVPSTTPAEIAIETMLSSVDVEESFAKAGGAYRTAAAEAGRTPVLEVAVKLTLGSLRLSTE